MESATPNVTQLLAAWSEGDQNARDELIPLVYAELHRVAQNYLRRERRGHTLQSSALVHEAFLRLVDQRVAWRNRAHFFGIAAQMMRRILVDYARSRGNEKHGGDQLHLELDEALDAAAQRDAELVALDDALNSLAEIDPQQSRVIELRYFGGLTIEETAEALGISDTTVEREWRLARAWLRRELSK
ncbi:MAG TPA: sigma-70 family RNA polymerase sigma factor [Blastocatellia bacterium]|nr:sigma-70 family RNA polymerase sigma factor [Blastocatellia bacterium]HMV87476.1 sigma-70 family RNA polymerase sigma factor [Blastocatellia bacterium]HMX28766.1 sigma-70 family RNA polymerase sigma factor [Blastocatellia bacterium]HMZ22031.1 sigma-70 family RNA polymerase sigma factor [Blastocatellia bacterium]HNG33360.1 sigma-70 family RNA polymerase sigma factor [Blastocatellia bacterium]